MLVEKRQVPPAQYVALTKSAGKHLKDVSSNAQKAALTLLTTLMLQNPFSGNLASWRFRDAVTGQKELLQVHFQKAHTA